MTHLDLFSGIGGFALAAQAAGFQTIGFSEVEPYACKILKRHWPEVPNYGDIRNVRGIACDLITGGFPCQPFSLAGKRKGASDDRALWPEMLRVISESRPRWVLGENVPGIISMELDRVLSDLENLHYTVWPLVVPACAVDAKHRRSRVWIVAHAASITAGSRRYGRPEARTKAANGSHYLANAFRPRLEIGQEQSARQECQAIERSRDAVSDASRNGRHERNTDGGRLGKGASAEEERSRLTDYCRWQPEPELGRVAHGIPNRSHRLKGLGNAIVPQVAEVILKEIMRITNQKNLTWPFPTHVT